MPAKQLMSLTDAAAARVKTLMGRADHAVHGLRIGVDSRGCSGLSYRAEYAYEVRPTDEVVEDKGVRLYIEPTATLFMIGAEIDYKEDKLTSGFVFSNPNETGRCGCGESFTVGQTPAR